MKWITVTVALITLFTQAAFAQPLPPAENTIYDSDTNHLWNRLNETLFERTAQDGKKYGLDELDILYWVRTTNLLSGASHQRAMAVLNKFINFHGEKLIQDPFKRALLQRDLWELFDWSAGTSFYPVSISGQSHLLLTGQFSEERRELQSRLALVIRRLALTTNEIASLPNNYVQAETKNLPDLPHGLFQTNGDWVSVGDKNDSLTAPTHVSQFNGHSVFCVMVHMPDGRQAAIDYLNHLRSFKSIWVDGNQLNPDLPQFPTNTEWALVRRMCVIDTDGNIQPTPIMESVQMRRYYGFGHPTFEMVTNMNGFVVPTLIPPQNFYEFQMNRRQNGELREIGKDEKGFAFVHFMGMGTDLFEYSFRSSATNQPPRDSATLQNVELRTCIECHSSRGIFSVNSYTRSLLPAASKITANLTPLDINREVTGTIDWKHRQSDWGLLQGLWRQGN
jgi:hypothetical protein